MELVPSNGSVIVNADNANACSIVHGLDAFTFGLNNEAADLAARIPGSIYVGARDIYLPGEALFG